MERCRPCRSQPPTRCWQGTQLEGGERLHARAHACAHAHTHTHAHALAQFISPRVATAFAAWHLLAQEEARGKEREADQARHEVELDDRLQLERSSSMKALALAEAADEKKQRELEVRAWEREWGCVHACALLDYNRRAHA